MSEETKEPENDGLGPCLALYHPNARHTGSALRMWLHPAVAGQDGCISLKIAEQNGHCTFGWAHALYVQLKATDLAKLLMVFQGWVEQLGRDGAGDNTIRLTEGEVTTRVHLSHRIEPNPGYLLCITRGGNPTGGSGTWSCERQIELSNAEALAISEAIRGAMSRVAFGDTLVLCGIDYGKEEE